MWHGFPQKQKDQVGGATRQSTLTQRESAGQEEGQKLSKTMSWRDKQCSRMSTIEEQVELDLQKLLNIKNSG
jgi:hypothetical protein